MNLTRKFSFFIRLSILILLGAYLIGFLTSCGGVLTLTWEAFFGGTDDDGISDIIQLNDGTYLAVGYTISPTSRDIYILKLDALGQKIFEITYDAGGKDAAYSVKETSDGFILTGFEAPNLFDLKFCVFKYYSDGTLVWHKTFGNLTVYAEGHSIDIAPGGYIVAGVLDNQGYILKIDPDGNSTWERIINIPGYDSTYFNCVKSVSDGYIVTGEVLDSSLNPYLLVLKVDTSGNQDWYYILNTAQSNGYCIAESQNGYVVAGKIQNFGKWNGYVFEISTDGSTINWTRTFGSFENDSISSIQPTNDGNFIVCGYYKSGSSTFSRGYVLKISSTDGTPIWERVFQGASNGPDSLSAIVQTIDGGYITAGYSTKDSGDTDAWVLKLDTNGSL
ncbi:MAG: hypothetical protein PWQ48_1399 [Thermotogaceae bacterium]|jgi:hypothetical protein|nr:hypothetical protein [Thermotogaceae bacterium]